MTCFYLDWFKLYKVYIAYRCISPLCIKKAQAIRISKNPTGFHEKQVLICYNMLTILLTGIPGERKLYYGQKTRINRSFSVLAIARVTGATSWRMSRLKTTRLPE